jgi:hypothetical protein
MPMKTSELTGAALDWAVAKCEDLEHYFEDGLVCLKGQPFDTHWLYWTPSTDWAQGGPIIERESILIYHEQSGKDCGRNFSAIQHDDDSSKSFTGMPFRRPNTTDRRHAVLRCVQTGR